MASCCGLDRDGGRVYAATRGRALTMVAAAVVAMVVGASVGAAQAAQYTVGGSSGWNLGVDYSTWASQYSFKTGDSLVFTYSGLHSVAQVGEFDYKACSPANAITTSTGGNTVVKLDKEQTYYFICGVAGHCASGMQLSVSVGAATSTSPSTATTTPSTSKSPPTTTTSPSGPSTNEPSLAPSLKTPQSLTILTIFFTILFYLTPKNIR